MSAAEFAEKLMAGAAVRDDGVVLDLDGLRIALRSNSAPLLDRLSAYFAHVVDPKPESKGADIQVLAVEAAPCDLGVPFTDWAREPGKTGRKDAYHDLPGGRLVRKVRTGMVFLQSPGHLIARGPCLANDNQVINFINAQYMNWLQQNGALICHAAGLVRNGACLGIAGFSGGGKSTLMLRMLEEDGARYLTNDRLFVKSTQDGVRAIGIPKLPRVNPGTIVGNPSLHSLLDHAQHDAFRAMPESELWDLEDKYDVDVSAVYGADKIVPEAPLGGFLILNWQRGGDAPAEIARVDLKARQDLLAAVMKSPGPFYQDRSGDFFRDTTALDAKPYLRAFEGIPVWEARGRLDFAVAAGRCAELMAWPETEAHGAEAHGAEAQGDGARDMEVHDV